MRRYPFPKALRDAARLTIAQGNLTLDQLAGMELDEFIEVCFPDVPRKEAWALACANRTPSRATLWLWSRDLPDGRDEDQFSVYLQHLQVHPEHLEIFRKIRMRADIANLSEAQRFAIETAGEMEKPETHMAILSTFKSGLVVGPVRVEPRHRQILKDLEELYNLSRVHARLLAIQMAGIN